jgi:alkylhydroperoxidase family enzyme
VGSDPVVPSSPGATDALNRLAPEVGAGLVRLQTDVWAAPSADRLALVDLRIAQLLGDDPVPWAGANPAPSVGPTRRQQLSQWPTSLLFSGEERAVLGFTEQFVIDVAGVDEHLRTELGSAIGPAHLFDVVVALFVLDYGRRVTMVLDRLFPDDPPFGSGGVPDGTAPEPGSSTGTVLLDGFDRLSRSVALLDGIDPVTTELVRLRGARQHNCRLCQSTRSARALDRGADEALFDCTERHETSDLDESRKVALRLTDAIITGPGSVDPSLAGQVHRWFTPEQVVELVMDVMRNSGQKIAVALAADEPHVTSGIERFEITADGAVEYLV